MEMIDHFSMINEEFGKRIEGIDNELSKHRIPVFARPIQATILYQKKYKINNIMFGGPLIGPPR